MIFSICIGRGGSKGFPGKNKHVLNGHPMMTYPLRASMGCKDIDFTFFSSEDHELLNIAKNYGATTMDRSDYLATDEALCDDVFVAVYEEIKKNIPGQQEYIVLLFANAPCVTSEMISEMISILRKWPGVDSICTVSKYPMYSPYRMRKIVPFGHNSFDIYFPGWLRPVLDCEEMMRASCDRNSGEEYWIYDCSCAVIRPWCLAKIKNGLPPQKWLGEFIMSFKQKDPALDVDYEYQIAQVEWWLKRNWREG